MATYTPQNPDDAAFTVGSQIVSPIGGLADESATDSVDEGDVGALRMTLDRKLLTRVVGSTDANRLEVSAAGAASENLAQVAGSSVTAGAGSVAAGTQRVTLASDDPAVASLGIIDDWDESDRAKVNIIVGHAGVSTGSSVTDAGTQRVIIATDDPNLSTLSGTVRTAGGSFYIAISGKDVSNNPTPIYTDAGGSISVVGSPDGGGTLLNIPVQVDNVDNVPFIPIGAPDVDNLLYRIIRLYPIFTGGTEFAVPTVKISGAINDTFSTTAAGTASTALRSSTQVASLQVVQNGTVTSWTVVLEGSLDGGTTYGTIASHVKATHGDGGMVSAAIGPMEYIRLRCSAITLGGGTDITAYARVG